MTADKALSIGLSVFPCQDDKRPACPRGFKNAAIDPAGIHELWRRYPGPLIGVPTGPASGFDVLDIDPRHGGLEWLDAERHRLPPARAHRTRSGGFHVFFATDPRLRNSAGRIAPGVDVRAAGGYVIWWPAAGLPVKRPDLLPDWPSWLLETLLPPPAPQRPAPSPLDVSDRYVQAAIASACGRVSRAGEGARNETLNAEAFALARFVEQGLVGAGGLADALAYAAATAGLPPREIAATLNSALRARRAA